MINPYISVVIVGRNDNYGVGFAERLSNFIEHLDRQIKNYPTLLELILVEWNPLSERSPIKEILPKTDNLLVRVLTVDNETHLSVGNKVPVYEFYAKNAGARRANGEFVLVTNPDILFTDELITELSKRRLRDKEYYRLDRYDFNSEGMSQLPKNQWIDFAIRNTFQANLLRHSFVLDPVSSIWHLPRSLIYDRSLHTNGSGDFILTRKSSLDQIGGLFEDPEEIYHNDSYSIIRLEHYGLTGIVFPTPFCIFHQHHPADRSQRDPWDVNKANRLAYTTGLDSWGLKDHKLLEWSNR